MLLPYLLGSMALCLNVIANPASLKCGDVLYDPTMYTCYNSKQLCPMLNGSPTKACGEACYSPYMYSCSKDQLTLMEMDKNPFYLEAYDGNRIQYRQIQACHRYFWIKDGGPCSYCPDSVPSQGGKCPDGNYTVLVGGRGMDTMVPGGQMYYVEPSGALGFTIAHSGSYPPGSIFGVDAYEKGGYVLLGSRGWVACPANRPGFEYQIFAQLPTVKLAPDCIGIDIVTKDWNSTEPAAWQYD